MTKLSQNSINWGMGVFIFKQFHSSLAEKRKLSERRKKLHLAWPKPKEVAHLRRTIGELACTSCEIINIPILGKELRYLRRINDLSFVGVIIFVIQRVASHRKELRCQIPMCLLFIRNTDINIGAEMYLYSLSDLDQAKPQTESSYKPRKL